MFIINEGKNKIVLENQKLFAEEVGISEETLSRILSGKQKCSKVTAYSITKHYNNDKEIEEYFERVD